MRKTVVDRANSQTDPIAFLTKPYYKDRFRLKFCPASRLSTDDRNFVFQLMERNMQELYERSSKGWRPKAKRAELFDLRARYLFVVEETFLEQGQSVGFVHFRFDLDYGVPVVYLYEIQLADSVHRLGIGRFLINVLEQMCRIHDMEKVVCTVSKHNVKSESFFRALGFAEDETCPDETDCEYLILSKSPSK